MELLIANMIMMAFLIFSLYQLFRHKESMKEGAYHHMVSHTYMLFFFLISMNIYAIYDNAVPLLFTVLHLLQHVAKENKRLIETGRWTPTVKDV